MNEKLEKLNQEIEKDRSKKLRRAQHKEKMLEHQIKTLTRKERTHRLCTRGAMLESHLPHPESVTDEQVSSFLKVLFHRGSTRSGLWHRFLPETAPRRRARNEDDFSKERAGYGLPVRRTVRRRTPLRGMKEIVPVIQ